MTGGTVKAMSAVLGAAFTASVRSGDRGKVYEGMRLYVDGANENVGGMKVCATGEPQVPLECNLYQKQARNKRGDKQNAGLCIGYRTLSSDRWSVGHKEA